MSKFRDHIEDDNMPRALDVHVPTPLPPRREPEVVEKEVIIYDPNAIQRHDDGTMTYKRFTMTPVGLIVPEDVDKDELRDVAKVIHGVQTSIQWIVGDLMNSMKRIWGDTYQLVAEELGYEIKTVQEWASICRKVSIRMETLTFGHHQLVAPYPPEDQQRMLEWAANNQASIRDLRKAIANWTEPDRVVQMKLRFSPSVTEGEHHSYIHLTRIRNAIKGKQRLTANEILADAIQLKAFAEQVIKDMGGE
jgi:hypothetical protein